MLSGGAGADYLTGGAGNDTFVLEPSAGATLTLADVITDFTAGDHLGLSGGLTYNDLIVAQGVGDHAADTIITTGGAYLAILQNVDHNSITAASFAMI